MKTAVRYYSRSGNTKLLAEALARGAGTEAVSVEGGELTERADVLFVGGALYAYGLDKKLRAWLDALDPGKVGKAVVFSTSWLSRHGLELIRQALTEKGIPVDEAAFYAKNRPTPEQLAAAERFAGEKVAG